MNVECGMMMAWQSIRVGALSRARSLLSRARYSGGVATAVVALWRGLLPGKGNRELKRIERFITVKVN